MNAGALIYDLRKQIQQIQIDLKDLGDPVSEIPELITSTNLLRSNEYLYQRQMIRKTELLSAFMYNIQNALEELLILCYLRFNMNSKKS